MKFIEMEKKAKQTRGTNRCDLAQPGEFLKMLRKTNYYLGRFSKPTSKCKKLCRYKGFKDVL